MPISDHYRGGSTERLLVQIITVDPPSGRIEGVGKDAAVIQIGNARVPPVFRWPIEGEFWSIIRDNGIWTLEALIPNPDDTSTSSLNPGDALVQAKTIWTPDGERLIKTGDAAGGVLAGAYPNPIFAQDMATQLELDSETTARTTADSALSTRASTLESRTKIFTASNVSSLSLGSIDGDNITGVRVSYELVWVNTTSSQGFLYLTVNGLASISAQYVEIQTWWPVGGPVQVAQGSNGNLALLPGFAIGFTAFVAPGTMVISGSTHMNTKALGFAGTGAGARFSNSSFSVVDQTLNGNNFLQAQIAGHWNDGTTAITSLGLAPSVGTISGRVVMEILP